MMCIKCGDAKLKKQKARVRGEIKGEIFVVSMLALLCSSCGSASVDGNDMPEYMRLVADAYRAKHGLLTSEEIRKRRQRLGMSQAEFAEYFGFSVRTLQEWEQGRSVPRGVARNFLILLQREPEMVRSALVMPDLHSQGSLPGS